MEEYNFLPTEQVINNENVINMTKIVQDYATSVNDSMFFMLMIILSSFIFSTILYGPFKSWFKSYLENHISFFSSVYKNNDPRDIIGVADSLFDMIETFLSIFGLLSTCYLINIYVVQNGFNAKLWIWMTVLFTLTVISLSYSIYTRWIKKKEVIQ